MLGDSLYASDKDVRQARFIGNVAVWMVNYYVTQFFTGEGRSLLNFGLQQQLNVFDKLHRIVDGESSRNWVPKYVNFVLFKVKHSPSLC